MFNAKIILDSVNVAGNRLTTMEVTFPRPILAEFNTHRVFSRNSASSRAIPVTKTLEKVRKTPFVPVNAAWGKNQKGMQSSVPLSAEEREQAVALWLEARDFNAKIVEKLTDPNGLDVHKQIANRLLEPFMWHTAIVTATMWDNFFNLRNHGAAEPHMQIIGAMMEGVYTQAKPPVLRQPGVWHLPYVDGVDLAELEQSYDDQEIARISCARCARVSYLTHDGKRDPQEDLALSLRLREPVLHASPFEHAARAMKDAKPSGNFVGWAQYRKMIPNEAVFQRKAGAS